MAITAACHVEPVVESGVMSIVVTCQSMMEPLQEVEQSRGYYCGLPGSPSPSAKAQLEFSMDEAQFHAESGRRSIGSECRMALEGFKSCWCKNPPEGSGRWSPCVVGVRPKFVRYRSSVGVWFP